MFAPIRPTPTKAMDGFSGNAGTGEFVGIMAASLHPLCFWNSFQCHICKKGRI